MNRPPSSAAPPSLWEQHRARLDAFGTAKVNYDPTRASEYTAEAGWRIDDYETDLPAEPPGPPVPDGSFVRACAVVRDYRFPPPDLVTGIFAPDGPLDGRRMLIRARFLGFTFWFGVEVGGVVDEERPVTDPTGATAGTTDPAACERVWGYHYRTLEGHFEKGEITFTVHKHLGTGRVVFRVHAYSQPDRIRNPFYRLGFKLFGRMLQRRFAHESLARMQELVREPLPQASSPASASTPATPAAVPPPTTPPPAAPAAPATAPTAPTSAA